MKAYVEMKRNELIDHAGGRIWKIGLDAKAVDFAVVELESHEKWLGCNGHISHN